MSEMRPLDMQPGDLSFEECDCQPRIERVAASLVKEPVRVPDGYQVQEGEETTQCIKCGQLWLVRFYDEEVVAINAVERQLREAILAFEDGHEKLIKAQVEMAKLRAFRRINTYKHEGPMRWVRDAE